MASAPREPGPPRSKARRRAFDARFSAGYATWMRRWAGVLWPRETGALAQILVALVAALLVAGLRPAAVALGTGAFALFMTHEPFLVVSGMRGGRARFQHGARAWRQLIIAPVVALAAGGLGLWLAPSGTAWLVIPALVPALVLTPLVLGRLEKTAEGELLVAATIAGFTLPVVRAGGVELTEAWAVYAVFAASLVVATLSVRRVTAKALRATTVLRLFAPIATMLVSLGVLVGLSARGTFPVAAAIAPLPLFAFCLYITIRPPHLRHVRRVGWTLAATLSFAAVVVIVGIG